MSRAEKLRAAIVYAIRRRYRRIRRVKHGVMYYTGWSIARGVYLARATVSRVKIRTMSLFSRLRQSLVRCRICVGSGKRERGDEKLRSPIKRLLIVSQISSIEGDQIVDFSRTSVLWRKYFSSQTYVKLSYEIMKDVCHKVLRTSSVNECKLGRTENGTPRFGNSHVDLWVIESKW